MDAARVLVKISHINTWIRPHVKTNIDGAYVHEMFRNAVLAMDPLTIYSQSNILNSLSHWKLYNTFQNAIRNMAAISDGP